MPSRTASQALDTDIDVAVAATLTMQRIEIKSIVRTIIFGYGIVEPGVYSQVFPRESTIATLIFLIIAATNQ